MFEILKFPVRVVLLALSVGGASTDSRASEPLVIFAASSLTNVVTELSQLFESQHNQETVISFAATSVLARQIKDGAPADVFLSANSAWMDDVIDAGMVTRDSQTVIAGNRLALAGAPGVSFPPVPGGALSADYPLATVAPDLPFAIGNPDHVPAGIYSRQALQTLGLWQTIEKRLIPMPNVRSVMANIDRGEVAGGFVYTSDLRYSSNARLIGLFPPSSHSPIQYMAGIVGGDGTRAARLFLAFLVSPEAENVFKQFGFLPPAP